MIANDTQHVMAVFVKAFEGSVFRRKQRARCIRAASQNCAESSANGATFIAVVRRSRLHQHGAEIGITQSKRAILPREFGDFLRWETGHQHRNFQDHRPEVNCMFVACNVEVSRARIIELQQIDRRQIARRVVEEHVFTARITRIDSSAFWARVPSIDCRIELDTRVCTVPCSFVDLSPKFSRIERLRNFAIGTANEIPISVGVYGVHELVAESYGVVGILTAHGVIRFTVEVIIQFQAESICNCMLRFAQLLHSFDQRSNLNFLADFPIYKRFDIRMIDIEAAHLCSSSSCPSRLDRSCGTVADLEETHQA